MYFLFRSLFAWISSYGVLLERFSDFTAAAFYDKILFVFFDPFDFYRTEDGITIIYFRPYDRRFGRSEYELKIHNSYACIIFFYFFFLLLLFIRPTTL